MFRFVVFIPAQQWSLRQFLLIAPHLVFLQVCSDDVLTKEEQIGLLFKAKRKCEDNIKVKQKIPGE